MKGGMHRFYLLLMKEVGSDGVKEIKKALDYLKPNIGKVEGGVEGRYRYRIRLGQLEPQTLLSVIKTLSEPVIIADAFFDCLASSSSRYRSNTFVSTAIMN